ncbi:hypothetical protein Sliba_09160 [Streptomyces nigrescens]|uniref:DUF3592 domain-containing protein n=1 Tax=Streptomyces nigrescens TaxID=1920 RepID=A0A640T9Q0_STRNI|nr:hypothetical protein Sliba_09160 [Streptomyces libani subsp. libani]GGV87097.1 hypothetical protein GCM10010500_06600 [Streptomyces libani subsp. libani]
MPDGGAAADAGGDWRVFGARACRVTLRRPVTSSSSCQRVTVQYDPEAPDRFAIEGWDTNVPHLLLTTLGAAFTVGTVTALIVRLLAF